MDDDREIKSFAIYPSIGIARVGNSPDEYFFGPELPGAHPRDPQRHRDASGRIKRQAARFRVYGLDADGEVVKEITAADARITWKVEVANKKAAWFTFVQALDVPASRGEGGGSVVQSVLRNAEIAGADRGQLTITPPRLSISGANVNAHGEDPSYAFDQGRFFDEKVYLGELRTDGEGRLVFLGGRGASASRDGQTPVTDFADNSGWHDDVSDGPVDALVEYQGENHEALGAWVVVAPPNYAPGIQGIVTGYDLLFDVAAQMDPQILPARPSFFEHVYPMLRRLTASQWVNAGFARDFGFGTRYDFESPELVARLSDPGEGSYRLRQAVFALFRKADYPYPQPAALPGYYGDDVSLDPQTRDPREWMALLASTQYRWLARWAEGDFVPGTPTPVRRWEALSAAEQVSCLDRGVLEHTLGGPFHPGCEFTWPMRSPLMYSAPFRIKRRTAPEPDLGPTLSFANALGPGGPLDGSTAGDVTRWMAVPWQTDTASCLSGYVSYVDDYLPTFWPARVPNDVLSEDLYEALVDPATPPEKKEDSFAHESRVKWLGHIVYAERKAFPPMLISPSMKGPNDFITDWWKVGIVVEREGPGAPSQFPASLWVETGRMIEPSTEPHAVFHISEHPRFRRR